MIIFVFIAPLPGMNASAALAAEHEPGVGFPYNLYPPNPYGPPRPRSNNIMREGALRPGVPNPEILYPRGPFLPGRPGFIMTRDVGKNDDAPADAAIPTMANPATRASQIPGLITACWKPPVAKSGDTMQITVRISFTVSGNPIGEPVITYISATDPKARDQLRTSLIAALKRCTPLPISAGLGKAIAGRPFAIRFLVGDTI